MVQSPTVRCQTNVILPPDDAFVKCLTKVPDRGTIDKERYIAIQS
jgi:hypothetical protein